MYVMIVVIIVVIKKQKMLLIRSNHKNLFKSGFHIPQLHGNF